MRLHGKKVFELNLSLNSKYISFGFCVFLKFVNFYSKSYNINLFYIKVNLITVKLSNLNKISKRTELSRTNSILSRQNVREILRIFLLFLCFFVKRSDRNESIEHNSISSSFERIILSFDRTESNFLQKKTTKIIKKFECGSP
jgi:hypothetical protein